MISRQAVKSFLIVLSFLLALPLLNSCGSSSSKDYGGITLTKIEVLPYNYSMKIGTSQQYYAVAIYADGSKEDITKTATWSVSNDNVASISTTGVVNASGTGTVSIIANQDSRSGQTTLTVHDKPTSALQIYPAEATLALGSITPFRAVAIFNDGTQQNVVNDVEASLENDSGIIVPANQTLRTGEQNPVLDQFALAEAVVAGSDTLIALFDGVTGTAAITVIDDVLLEQIVVEPTGVITTVGTVTEFFATGIYSDGSSRDLTETVTWGSSDTLVATISNDPNEKGIATSLAPGTTTISATLDTFGGTAAMTVNNDTAPVITSVVIDPSTATILPDEVVSYTAYAIFSDNSLEEVTAEATWASSNEAVAVIGNDAEYVGKALGIAPGETTITATYNGVASNNGNLTINPPEIILERIEITPTDASTPKGTLLAYTATALYSDGTTTNVTTESTWESSDVGVAYIVTANAYAGTTYAVAAGTTQIQATYLGQQAATTITVTPAVLDQIVVYPVNETVPAGTRVVYRAVGIYSDLTYQEITQLVTWQTSDMNVAVISNIVAPGLAITIAPGDTTISATLDGIVGATALEITPAVLESIQVTPPVASQPAGTSIQFSATAYYTDNSSEDATAFVTWESSDTAVVHISNDPENVGVAQGLVAGSATITASINGISGTASMSVTPAVLMEVSVTPVTLIVPAIEVHRYTATGIYSDNTHRNLTLRAGWQSTDPEVAITGGTGGRSGFVAAVAEGDALISATVDGVVGQGEITVTPAVVTSIQVTPANLVEPAGTSGFMQADAALSDGTVEDVTTLVTWTSSDPAVVTVISSSDPSEAGKANMIQTGTANVTATLNTEAGPVSDVVPVEVTAAILVEIQVDPVVEEAADGVTVQYHAEGIYSDGSKTSIDEDVSWQSDNLTVATIDLAGKAQTLAPGETTITATLGTVFGAGSLTVTTAEIVDIQINPANPNLPVGTYVPFTAVATFTDNTSGDVTSDVTWLSSDSSIVSMVNAEDDPGLAVLLATGNADVSAVLDELSDTVPVVVTPAVLVEINVSPVVNSMASGLDEDYEATGVFSDGTQSSLGEEVSWTSSSLLVATVSTAGNVQALTPGLCTITATLDGVKGRSDLEVREAAVTQIQITPANLVEPAGTSGNLTATATMTDASTSDVTRVATWTSSAPEIVSVSNADGSEGVASLLSVGNADVTAAYQGVTDTVPVEVTTAILTEIQVTPLVELVASGLTVEYTAKGIYSDGTITSIDSDVAWSSSDPDIATIDLDGTAETLSPGSTVISASLDGLVGQASLDVTAAIVIEIQITPGNISEPVGTSGYLTATALMSDGSNTDVTSVVTWTSSSSVIASVVTGGSEAGFITFLSLGTCEVTATLNAIQRQNVIIADSINVTVTEAVLVEILLSPVLYSMPLGQSVAYTAEGVFSDGSRTPINSSVAWLSSDTKVATIDPTGFADSISVGSVTITATYSEDISASTTLTINPAVITRIELEPQNVSLVEGSTQAMTVTAIYSDGTTETVTEGILWQTTDPAVAVVDDGLLIAQSSGAATITARVIDSGDTDFDFSDTSEVTVSAATLVSLTLSTDQPVIHTGEVAYFLATGEYNNGTLQNLTNDVTWSSLDTSIAIASNETDNEGQVFGEGVGETDIRATFEGLADTHPITVTPSPLVSIAVEPATSTIGNGLSKQYKAIGTYADGTTEDITWNVNWTSSDLAVAEVDAFGLAQSAGPGDTVITASRAVSDTVTISGTADLTVDSSLPTDFRIEPVSAQIVNGTAVRFRSILTVNGVDDDITTESVWTSANISVATISNADGTEGIAQSAGPGTVTITAEYVYPPDLLFTATATLEVLDFSRDPDRLEVTPITPSIAVNGTQQFILTGYWTISGGGEFSQDLTTQSQTQWKSSDKKVATISNDANQGLATGLKAGSSNIEGKYKGSSRDETTLTVTP